MNKVLLLLLAFFLVSADSPAQLTRYIIQLKDKSATTHSLGNPSQYLSKRAIERRTRYHIPIDSTDLPVPKTYIDQIQQIPQVTLLNVSRWLNAVTIQTNSAVALAALGSLPFVQRTSAIASRPPAETSIKFIEDSSSNIPGTLRPTGAGSNFFDYGANSLNEIHAHNGEFLHNIGLRGQGMQIAMLDGGFFNYTSLDAFDSVNANGQVLSTWDFVDRHSSVVEDHPHGMQCFSIIAANIPGQFVGKAPRASFHLFRTEDAASEYPIEEFNWACGAERADSMGADIISSSLGYGYLFNAPVPDYPYSTLNGDITLSARAADLAASKGLLVLNSAGNSGNDYWRMITTPADADSIIAVGASNTTGLAGSFSSYGPAADGRIKPDVSSIGVGALFQTVTNTLATGNGTSFSCPNMAGLATCLWQGFPEFNNMRIIKALKEAGHLYPAADDQLGYGLPDMKKAFSSLLKEFVVLSAAQQGNCQVSLNWTGKDRSGMKYEIERKSVNDTGYTRVAVISSANGDVLSNHQYQYTDALNGLPAGSLSYRLRQILDNDASNFFAVYIDTVQLNIQSPCSTALSSQINVAPNPVTSRNSSLIIETENAIAGMTIVIFDMEGRLVMKWRESKTAGRMLVDLPVQKLNKGQYIIKVYDENKTVGKTIFLKL